MKNGLIIDQFGTKKWYKDNLLHREDGPAIEHSTGYSTKNTWWYKEGRLHRIDGPAIEYSGESREWWVEGKKHRLDGPAVEWNEDKEWFYEDEYIECNSQEEFERIIRLKMFW